MWRMIIEMRGDGPTTDEEIDAATEPVVNAIDAAGIDYMDVVVDE